jgi:hypothetical protein
VLIEEPFDLSGLDDHPLVAGDRPGQLLEAGVGLADKLHQDQNRDFRRQRNAEQSFGRLALNGCNAGIRGKVDVGASDPVPLKPGLSAELNKNGMAPASEFCAKLLCAHTGGASGDQVHQSMGQAPCTREAHVAVKPQSIAVEAWNRAKRVPGPIVGETAVVTNLGQKTPNGWNGIAQLASQGLDPPARLFAEKSDKSFAGSGMGWHGSLRIKYCIQPNIWPYYAIHYQKDGDLPSLDQKDTW